MTSTLPPPPDMPADATFVPPPAPIEAAPFTQLGLAAPVLANLARLGYHLMTPIQAASLPVALAGDDLIAQAKTGSGKTAAFGLPLLQRLDPRHFAVQAMVLCPTRELAEQVSQEIRRLARFEENIKVLSLCGGSPIRPQVDSLAHGAHVVVGTPGRLMDHLSRGSLKLDALATLVLDEADKIRQRFYEVAPDQRLHAVGLLLRHYRPVSTLAFCNTKQQCRDLIDVLHAEGFHVLALHGELDQRDRDQVMVQFANRSCSVLVATDVAARGLDIAKLEAVINVDVTPDPEAHIHRIGRTGRADEDGWALSLVGPSEKNRVASIARANGFEPQWESLAELHAEDQPVPQPPMVTLQILGGRKEKIRPGDVLGALTGEAGFTASQIGKINVNEQSTYVAVARGIARQALKRLLDGRIKGKKVRVRLLDE